MEGWQTRFLDQLLSLSRGRVRLPAEQIWQAFGNAFPEEQNSPNRRAVLLDKLTDLEREGHITTPKDKRQWDHAAEPASPHWIALSSNKQDKSPKSGHRSVAWRPELRFVADLNHIPHLDELLRINEFLKANAASRPLVPLRERSVQLFGDEKRLESLAAGSLFQPGRLSLETLRCFSVSPPLVWEKPDVRTLGDRPLLIIENHHTYWSFCQWNRPSGHYASIVYGHGKMLESSVGYLGDILVQTEASAIEYFGDIDPDGIRIPVRASAKARQRGLPCIGPAERWYRLLLDAAETAMIATTAKGKPLIEEHLQWLPPDLRGRAKRFLSDSGRIPQELIGWERLSEIS